MRNSVISGTVLLREAAETIRRRLPHSWEVRELTLTDAGPDAILRVRAPDGVENIIIVEARARVEPRDVSRLESQFRSYAIKAGSEDAAFLLVAPYLSARARELLDEAGIAYVDQTGSIRLAMEQPAVYVERAGTGSNPFREDRPLHSLKGPAAGRVVRALCDFAAPYGVRELADRSGTPAATVSRVVALLDRDAIVTKDSRARIVAVDWRALIRRWTQDYSLMSSNRTQTYLEPRGLPELMSKLKASPFQYAVTGSLAGAAKAPIAAPRLATLYVEDRVSAAATLSLRPAESGANVVLAEPFDNVVFDRCWDQDNVRFSAPSQVAADLLTSPGRGPSEGQELLEWMEGHERDWRLA
jgi:hypothetical protein